MTTLQGKVRQLLVLSALGTEAPGTVRDLTAAIADSGCNILDCQMRQLGNEVAMQMQVDGPWDTVARLEQAFPRLERDLKLRIIAKRSEQRQPQPDRLPYAVDAISMDRHGIVHSLLEFFIAGDVHVTELHSRTYPAAITGAPMLSVQLSISIPADMHIGTLREDFTDFCDRFNLDAVMEPIKS